MRKKIESNEKRKKECEKRTGSRERARTVTLRRKETKEEREVITSSPRGPWIKSFFGDSKVKVCQPIDSQKRRLTELPKELDSGRTNTKTDWRKKRRPKWIHDKNKKKEKKYSFEKKNRRLIHNEIIKKKKEKKTWDGSRKRQKKKTRMNTWLKQKKNTEKIDSFEKKKR